MIRPSRARSTRSARGRLESLEARQLLAGDLTAHWLAQDLLPAVADGATPEVWVDRVTSAPANPEGAPTLVATGAGGRAALRFDPSDGIDRFRVESDVSPVAGAAEFSVAVVFSTVSSAHNSADEWFGQSGLVDGNSLGFGNDWGTSIDADGRLAAGISGGFQSPARTVKSSAAGFNDGSLHTLVFTRSGAEIALYADDAAAVSRTDASPVNRDLLDLSIGALQTEAGGFDGLISEVRVYNGALDAAEIASLRTELDAFYNNLPPQPMADSFEMNEDQLLFVSPANGVLANDTDPEGDSLTAELVDEPANGLLGFNADGSFVYDPNDNFFGTDTFSYAAVDFRRSDVVQVTIEVAPTYDPVVPQPETFRLLPTGTFQLPGFVGVLANDINIDRAPLTAVLSRDVSFGQLTFTSDGGFTYDPQGTAGVATFEYQVDDGTSLSVPQEVTLIVNTPPVGVADNYTLTEDVPRIVAAEEGVVSNDVDVDGDTLTAELVTDVTQGTLALQADGSFAYTPFPDYFGTDQFTYIMTDGDATSGEIQVELTVEPVNDPPATTRDTYFGTSDDGVVIPAERGVLANDVDIDSPTLSAQLVSNPQNGTVTLNADGSLNYVADAGFTGEDTFVYRASDGTDLSEPTEVQVFVGASPIQISEIMVANVTSLETRRRAQPEDRFRGDEERPDWLELQNLAPGDLDISGFHLSNQEGNLTQWKFPEGTSIPGNGYLIVYGSDIELRNRALDETETYHTNFKLSLESEYVALSDQDGNLLDEFGYYPDQYADVSYGRTADGQMGYFVEATPAAINSTVYVGITGDTRFSVDRGFYSEPFEVEITNDDPNESIFFSFDGSVPTPADGRPYTGPITIDQTTTLRAATYRDGYLTADVDTQTYVFVDQVIQQSGSPVTGPSADPVTYPDRWRNLAASYEMEPDVTNAVEYRDEMHDALTSLPTLSITLPQEEIFGPDGLYSNPQRTTETHSSAELIYPDGRRGFQVDSGLRMQGGASRNPEHYKHSMSLRFREDYGTPSLDFPLFEESAVSQFDSLHLRARYNNSWIHWDQGQRNRGTMMREMWMRDSMLAMGEPDAGHGDYVHVYLNGLYWGIYEMHERQDASHFARYNGGEAYQYDATNANVAVDGTRDSLDAMQDVVADVDTLGWDAVTEVLNVDNQIRYKILMEFGGNQDLKTDGNWRAAGGGLANAPWEFFVWDAERVLENVRQRGTQPVRDLLNVFNRLDEHPEYRMRFADIVHELFFNDGALTPEQTAARWLARKTELDTAIIAESARWGDQRTDRGQRVTLERDVQWEAEHRRLFDEYFPERSSVVLDQFRGSMYPATEAPEFLVDDARQHGGALVDGAQLTVLNPNGDQGTVYYTTDGSDPRLQGGDVNPTAIAHAGGALPIQSSTLVRMRILNGDEWSAISQAQFVTEVLASADNLRITEINYHPQDARPDLGELDVSDRSFEFLEFTNISAIPVNLAGAALAQVAVDGNAEGVVYQFGPSVLAPGESKIVVRNRDAFESRYGAGNDDRYAPGTNGIDDVVGQWTGGSLSNGGERITLLDAGGGIIQRVTYNDQGSWSGRADGRGSTLELIDPAGDANDGNNWRPSWTLGGTPASENVLGERRVVINEVLTNSNDPLVDQIELHNLTSEAIDLSNWRISDNVDRLDRFQIPAGTQLPANGYLVFDQTTLGFGLKGQESDNAYLTSTSGGEGAIGIEDFVSFDASDPDGSLGRWPNASGTLFPQVNSSLGSANAGPRIPDVFISEVMYHGGLLPDGVNTNEVLEFVELANTSGSPVDVGGWRLNNGVDFEIPDGTVLADNEAIVVVSFDPVVDNAALTEFLSVYNLVDQPRLLGPYQGRLDNGGERLEWQRPVGDGGGGFILEDVVRYDDVAPWPVGADGTGRSLQRTGRDAFGNDALSWRDQVPTPSEAGVIVDLTYDFTGDGAVGADDIDRLCQGIQASDAVFDLNQDGAVDLGDLDFMVTSVLRTTAGDANLDGRFNSRDLVDIFQFGQYQDGVPGNSTWATGDWNCDGEFTSSDLVVAFQAGGYTLASEPQVMDASLADLAAARHDRPLRDADEATAKVDSIALIAEDGRQSRQLEVIATESVFADQDAEHQDLMGSAEDGFDSDFYDQHESKSNRV